MSSLDDDLNTSNAITVIYNVLKADINSATKIALLNDFDRVLSLDIVKNAEKALENTDSEIPEEVTALVEKRAEARKAKDFALADSLRDKITALGYVVEETRQGTKIYKA